VTTAHAITVAAKHGFHVVFPVDLIDPDDRRVLDWAEPYLSQVNRWDIGWLLGRYVHADTPNRNGHIFPLDDLKDYYKLVNNTPLNVLHRPRDIIGTFIASELLWPTGSAEDAVSPDPPTPWVETLAAVWRHVFPQMYAEIKDATARGVASLSMEAYPKRIGCGTCDAIYPFDGTTSKTYTCGHLEDRRAPKRLYEPHFVGGGVILPPARPGWRDAQIKQVAALFEQDPVAAEALDDQLTELFPGVHREDLEAAMAALIAQFDLVDAPAVRTATRMPGHDVTVTCPKCGATMTESTCEECGYVSAADMEPFDFEAMIAEAWAALGIPLTDDGSGAMVAIFPPPEVAEVLAGYGTEERDELHVTVVYLGAIDELDYTADDVVAALAPVAETAETLTAKVSGVGRFNLEDGTEATYASIDAPGLNGLYEAVTAALTAAGLAYAANHGYTPHLTLAYHPAGEGPTEMPPTLQWPVTDLHLVWDGAHTVIPFAPA
jgi:2'-5' RNA ligase